MIEKTCNLCRIRAADKLNSHIIPKFMCKRLFENSKPRHTVMLTKKGKQIKLQDSSKENNILCTSCEKRLEILETYFGRIFIDLNGLQNAKQKYDFNIDHGQEVLICHDLKPTLFKLFIFSLIWRSSISKLLVFETFNLKEDVEEELRVFLDTNLKLDHNELLKSVDNIDKIPRYHSCFIKPKYKTRGIYTAYEFGEDAFAIYTVDYALFFYTQNTPLVKEHVFFSNRDDEKVKIVFGDDNEWEKLNKLVVDKMINHDNEYWE